LSRGGIARPTCSSCRRRSPPRRQSPTTGSAPWATSSPIGRRSAHGFPRASSLQAITDFDGKTFGYSFTSNQRINNLLLFNKDYLQQAGYDPDSKPLTWDEFRAACKKCTDQGPGTYYGLIIGIAQSGQLPGFIASRSY